VTVAGNVTIANGGRISADAQGYVAGKGPGGDSPQLLTEVLQLVQPAIMVLHLIL